MIQQVATPAEVELFVKTAVDKLTANGMSQEDAVQRVGAVLQKRAEELGMVNPEQISKIQKQASAQTDPSGQQSGQELSAEEYVLGLAHEKLVKAGMSEEAAVDKLIAHLSK